SPIAKFEDTLSPEEAVDHLELPDVSSVRPHRPLLGRPKDTYHFYQASGGQHIYMHSLNAQCLSKEYGNLENSPRTITATVVAIERIFMTEEMRKRLRYLNHIPLTTEFHVVELKIKPPVLSKETLKHFQPDFDKRRKFRQRKAKEEKKQASKNDVEFKKAHGIYVEPEVHIPLDNTAHFPSHLASYAAVGGDRQRRESTNSDIFPDTVLAANDAPGSPVSASPRQAEQMASSPSFASFAQVTLVSVWKSKTKRFSTNVNESDVGHSSLRNCPVKAG
ncbi:RING finger protein 10-like, partial [Elysia marginata]